MSTNPPEEPPKDAAEQVAGTEANATPGDGTEMPTKAVLPPRPRPRWRWLALFLAVVIFASGFIAGGGITLVTLRNTLLYYVHHPEQFPPVAAARLRSKLDLTDEQTRQVDEILRKRQAALQAIRREVQPRVLAELDLVEQEVAKVLTPEQRERWHKRFGELRETWTPPMPEEGG
jgi:hypothetical protein